MIHEENKANKKDDEEEDNQEEKIEADWMSNMPPSWCRAIQITPRQFEYRAPNGTKIILYKRAKVRLNMTPLI